MKKILILILTIAMFTGAAGSTWSGDAYCGWDLGDDLEIIWFHDEKCADIECDCPACQKHSLKAGKAEAAGLRLRLNSNMVEVGVEFVVIDAAPYLLKQNDSSYVMVPLRYVSEQLGAQVDYDFQTQTITIN